MKELYKELKAYGKIRVGIVGCGLMGSHLLAQLNKLDHFIPVAIASRRIESIQKACQEAGIDQAGIKICHDLEEAKKYIAHGYLVATTDNQLLTDLDLDCLVDATGNTVAGAEISLAALKKGIHLVSLNVEMDVLIGPYLRKIARENRVVYTGTYGDEPGSIQELYEFCSFVGLEVIALGKGKNNPLNRHVTQEEVREEALKKGLSPRMLTSFVDGTNTMIELNCVCNATGFLPDIDGCHGLKANPENLVDFFGPDKKIKKTGVVDFVHGMAPGVFAIVKGQDAMMDKELQFLKMGKGPYYTIFRPYHLTSIETPISIAKAVIRQEESLLSTDLVAQTVALAKRDLDPGQSLGGIGSNQVYGLLTSASRAQEENLVPIGLLTEKAHLKDKVSKDQPLTFDQVELEDTLLYRIYQEM